MARCRSSTLKGVLSSTGSGRWGVSRAVPYPTTITEPAATRHTAGSGRPVTPARPRGSYLYRRYAGNPATQGKVENLYGIKVRESGAEVLVELWGEFDLFSLDDLRRTLNGVLDLRKKTLVNLFGITFLDLASARELAIRAQVYARHLTFHNPSPQVMASVEASGLGSWLRFHSGPDREEPPIFSEAPS